MNSCPTICHPKSIEIRISLLPPPTSPQLFPFDLHLFKSLRAQSTSLDPILQEPIFLIFLNLETSMLSFAFHQQRTSSLINTCLSNGLSRKAWGSRIQRTQSQVIGKWGKCFSQHLDDILENFLFKALKLPNSSNDLQIEDIHKTSWKNLPHQGQGFLQKLY